MLQFSWIQLLCFKERGVHYRKAFIPMTSNVVIDGNLITGQNPFSSKEMAKTVVRELEK
ncbi:putative intracellular protease/amidase [Chryseobacterium sediminis]|uniref:Intracellular protease/amidase n=1 Tax=Chryseobacterium sediminis TaxID=1679494 RepID=A0ABR6PX67_9FLAO|nr:hypothetical protein [Chryseobacterium sediminis]MBB6330307.1 putative intracellular protease/amidase [Chryseobacterium sediminis]